MYVYFQAINMERVVVCYPTGRTFERYEVYEFEGNFRELLVSLADLALEFETLRTFTYNLVLRREDFEKVMLELESRPNDIEELFMNCIDYEIEEAEQIARSLGIVHPALVYLVWDPEVFIDEEIEDLLAECIEREEYPESVELIQKFYEKGRKDPREFVGVELAVLNVKGGKELAEKMKGNYLAFVEKYTKFAIISTKCRVKIVDSSVFETAENESEFLQLLINLLS